MNHREHCTANTCCLDAVATNVEADMPDVATLAGYVLGLTEPPGTHAPPGDFYGLLIRTMCQADPENLRRLGAGFPLLASMIDAYKSDYHGLDRLRLAARTGEWVP